MALNFGMFNQFSGAEFDVGIGQKNDKFDIRYVEGDTQPPVAPGEIIIWKMGSGEGEFYKVDDAQNAIDSTNDRIGQTFTFGASSPDGAFTIASVTFKMYRTLTPGTVTCELTAVDGDGKPTGSVLATGTTDGDTLTTSTAGEERTITFTTPYTLEASTQYAVYVKASDASATDKLHMRKDGSSPTYTGGVWISSTDGGSSWNTVSTSDLWFSTSGGGSFMLVDVDGTTKMITLADAP